jgi:elongation factor 3
VDGRPLSLSGSATSTDGGGRSLQVDVQNAILAFAGRVLLRGCDLRFERGHRYGLIGKNGVGKTTLLNRLAAKDITGFPRELRVHFIRHEVLCAEGVTVRQYMRQQAPKGSDPKLATRTLGEMGFPLELQVSEVSALSGGWKMKLSIAISILHKPELLLLDEPTNHLDRAAVTWLTGHLNALTGVTILVVRRDLLNG